MPVPRDIALIFLCLQALVAGLMPLALLAGLAYGVYRLRGLVELGLRKAFVYAEMARDAVERASKAVAEPFIRVNATMRMITTILRKLVPSRR